MTFTSELTLSTEFPAVVNCDAAELMLFGDEDGQAIGLIADKKTFCTSSDLQCLVIASESLAALKHEGFVILITDEGRLGASRKGSGASINQAWLKCQTAIVLESIDE